MDHWRCFDGTRLPRPLPEEVHRHLEACPNGGKRCIYIGTDSQIYGAQKVVFVTAVVIHFPRTTRIYYRKARVHRAMPLAERLFSEVHRSLEAARLIQPVAGRYAVPIEIHVDVNGHSQFPSHQYLKGLIGYVSSMGYRYRVKPEAFASTSCADRLL